MFLTLLFTFSVMFKMKTEEKNFDCKISQNGEQYSGALANTYGGYDCQSWSSKLPHFHIKEINNSRNFCRNPSLYRQGVWCFTKSATARWQYCKVSYCKENKYNRGVHYGDGKNFTIHKNNCLLWIKSPEKFWNFPDKSLIKAKNYCRNPNNNPSGPWCYIQHHNYTKFESCFKKSLRFIEECSKYNTSNGFTNILIDDDDICHRPCLLVINYNDSDPTSMVSSMVIEYRTLNVYSDFLSDFNISIQKVNKESLILSIKETRFNHFICVNNKGLYLSKDDCPFTATCLGWEKDAKFPRFILRSSNNYCLIRYTGLDPCHSVYFIRNPPGYIFYPDQYTEIVRENDKLFNITISKVHEKVKGIVVPKIKEVTISAVSCVTIIYQEREIIITLNTTLSCKCRFLSYFHIKVILENFNLILIEREYYFSYHKSGIKCKITPNFESTKNPIIMKENIFFYFQVPEYGLHLIFSNSDIKKCLVEKDIQNATFYFQFNICCRPICYIIVPIFLFRYDGLKELGTYYFINVPDKMLSFDPDLVYVLFRPRQFGCKILESVLQINISKSLYFIDNFGVETLISEYILTNYTDKFQLKCICLLKSVILNATVVLDTIIRVFMIVKNFTAKIEWSGILKIGEFINCTIKEWSPPNSIQLGWEIRKNSTLEDLHYELTHLPSLNILMLRFLHRYEVGRLSMLCIASVAEVFNKTYYAYKSYSWIETDLRGLNNEWIVPIHWIIHAKESMWCANLNSTKSFIEVTGLVSGSVFLPLWNRFTASEDFRSGIYRITCIFNSLYFKNNISANKLLLIQNIFFYPDLQFYILNKHGSVECIRDPDISDSLTNHKFILEVENISKDVSLDQNKFLYFVLSFPRIITLTCTLMVKEKKIAPNTKSDVYPFVWEGL